MTKETQNLAQDSHDVVDRSADKAHRIVSAAADKTDQAIAATKTAAADAEQSIQDGLKQIREEAPARLSRATQHAEDLARAGIDKARAASHSVANQANHMHAQTVSYVREEPTKALLMAVAAGAFATVLIGWATRGNGNYRH